MGFKDNLKLVARGGKKIALGILGREWVPGENGRNSAGTDKAMSGGRGSSGFGGRGGMGGGAWDPWVQGNPAAENITGISVNVRWPHLTGQRSWTINDTFYLALMEAEQKDGHLSGLLEQRRRAVLSRERWMATDDDEGEGQLIQDMCEWALDGLEGFDQDLEQMLDALGKGFSVMEVIWGTRRGPNEDKDEQTNIEHRILNDEDRSDNNNDKDASRRDAEAQRTATAENGKGKGNGKGEKKKGSGIAGGEWLVPVGLKMRYPGRFRFNAEGGLEMMVDSLKSEPVPPYKFLVTTFDKLYENPYGNGLSFKCLWLSWFKKHGLKWWLVFNERFGAPAPLGKYPTGATKEQKDALMDVVRAFYQDTGVIIPEDMAIELIEAKRTAGNVSTYQGMCDWIDDQMSKMVIGSTLTSGEGRRTGSMALGMVHAKVASEKIEQDGRLLADTVNELVEWIIELNFGEVEKRPYWVVDTQTEEDLKQWVEIVTGLVKLGLPVPIDWFYKKFKIPTPGADERTLRFDDQNLYQYHMQYGVLMINEVRGLLGLEPVKWGDVPANIFQSGANGSDGTNGNDGKKTPSRVEELSGKVEEGEELVESIVEEAAGEFSERVRARKGEAGVVAMKEELRGIVRKGIAMWGEKKKIKNDGDGGSPQRHRDTENGDDDDASRRDAETRRKATAENGNGDGNGEKHFEHGGHGGHGEKETEKTNIEHRTLNDELRSFGEVEELAGLGRDVQIVDSIGAAVMRGVGEGLLEIWGTLRDDLESGSYGNYENNGNAAMMTVSSKNRIRVAMNDARVQIQGAIERVFGLAVMAGWAVGRGGAFRERERQMGTTDRQDARPPLTATTPIGKSAIPGAARFGEEDWTVEGALEWLRGKELMTVAEFGALVRTLRAAGLAEGAAQKEARKRAMSFAKAASEEAAALMRDGIERAISEGLTVGEFIDGTLKGLEEAGLDKTTAGYLENVFRTNAMGAYNEAQEELWRETWDDLWGFAWWNPVDARSRATHAALSGFRAPKEDPRWAEIGTPPLDYQCRCLKRAIYNVSANAGLMTTVEPRVSLSSLERF